MLDLQHLASLASPEIISTDLHAPGRATGGKNESGTYLVRVLEFVAPLDAVVPRDDDRDLADLRVLDQEALGEQRGLQALQVDEVLELEVAGRRFALAELLNELSEAVADALPGHDVVVLDMGTHLLGQEGLVAEARETG